MVPPAGTTVPSTPWTVDDAIRAGVGSLIAAVALGSGWYFVAGEPAVESQIGWLNLAIAGLLISAYVNAIWLLRGRRAVGERTDQLLAMPDATPRLQLVRDRTSDDDVFVAGVNLRFYHQPECRLAVNRGFEGSTREEQEAAGRTPCGVCRP